MLYLTQVMVNDVQKLWNDLKDKVEVKFELRHNSWGDTTFSIIDHQGNVLIFFTPDTI
jgi:uncharacterized glyoxalase superfamily protein PhnB